MLATNYKQAKEDGVCNWKDVLAPIKFTGCEPKSKNQLPQAA
jgi:hypothetical protein